MYFKDLTEEVTSEELEKILDKTFISMRHSVNLIDDYVSGRHSSELYKSTIKDIVKRNVDHLEIMINKDYISNSERDLSEFTDCINVGNQFLANY
jgi:hypothetical protein